MTIPSRIALAGRLRDTFGPTLHADKEVKFQLHSLERNIGATQGEMSTTGIVEECADCAVNGDGTCCGLRTGNKCDVIILLINLLMGRILPTVPYFSHLCYFLTDKGCALTARHVICVNYTCRRLYDNIPLEKLVHMQEIAGKEISTLFALEELLKKKIGFDTLEQYRRVNM